MSNTPIAVGIVGTSWWADSMHIPAVESHPNAKITAICGRNTENAQKMATTWNIPHVYTDFQAMIDSGHCDAIIISTPNDTHYPITLYALKAGLHVLCEKPTALTYTHSQELADVATQKGIIHMVPFTYRFMPTARYLKELISDGYIGKPYHLNMRYYTGFARDGDYLWRFDVEKAGSGIVGDLGSHFLHIAEWLCGDILQVSCKLGFNVERTSTDPNGDPYQVADDMCIITLEFANGASGVIHCSAVCYEDTPFGQTHHMEFHGSGGTLYSFTDWDTVQLVSGAKVGEGAIKELPIPNHIWGNARRDTLHNTYRDMFRQEDFMIRDFINGILENRPVKPDLQDGASVQRLIDAAILSHQERRWVSIKEIT